MKNMNFEVLVVPKVMKPDGTIVEYPKRHNLILNSGLDALATHYTSDCFLYAAVGIGTTPTYRSSGSITVSKTSSTITASGLFFTVADIGRTLQFSSSGTEVVITGYTSVSQVTCDTSGSESSQACMIYNTTQTSLTNLTKVSSTYYQGDGIQNGVDTSTEVASVRILKRFRTFQFAVETSPITYTEAGWSWGNPSTTNLFGRIVFAEGGENLSLLVGERLLLYVELNTYMDTSVVTIPSVPLSGATVSGTSKLLYRDTIEAGFWSRVASDGTSLNTSISTSGVCSAIEPYCGLDVCAFGISNSNVANPTDNTTSITDPTVGDRIETTAVTYVPGSYEKNYIVYFTTLSAFTWYDIRSLVVVDVWVPTFRIVFNTGISKTVTNVAELIMKKSWGRIL